MSDDSPAVPICPESLNSDVPPCGPPIGVFEGTADIGVTRPGWTAHNASSGIYQVTGGGTDFWDRADAFHMAWRRIFGDRGITADVSFPPGCRSGKEKALVLFRQSLGSGSAYVGLVLHGDGRLSFQYRQSQEAVTFHIAAFQQNATTLSIERCGGRFVASACGRGGRLGEVAMIVLPLHDPVYAGIGICAHDADSLATVNFSRVCLQ